MSDSRAIAAITAALGDMLGAEATLYLITPNSQIRNRQPPGAITATSVAIDLHFAISAISEAALGDAILRLARTPVLTSDVIDRHIGDPGLHGAIPAAEPVQIRMAPLGLAETTALWRALQRPLRPAAYYIIGPVLLT